MGPALCQSAARRGSLYSRRNVATGRFRCGRMCESLANALSRQVVRAPLGCEHAPAFVCSVFAVPLPQAPLSALRGRPRIPKDSFTRDTSSAMLPSLQQWPALGLSGSGMVRLAPASRAASSRQHVRLTTELASRLTSAARAADLAQARPKRTSEVWLGGRRVRINARPARVLQRIFRLRRRASSSLRSS